MSGRKRKFPFGYSIPEDLFAEHSESPERRARQQHEARHGPHGTGDPLVAPIARHEAQGEHRVNRDDDDPIQGRFRDPEVGELVHEHHEHHGPPDDDDDTDDGGPVAINLGEADTQYEEAARSPSQNTSTSSNADERAPVINNTDDGVNDGNHLPEFVPQSPNGKNCLLFVL